MSDEHTNPFDEQLAAHAAKVQAQKEHVASVEYQNEMKFISRITSDVLHVLKFCMLYSFRAEHFAEKSLVVRSTEDFATSVLAVWSLVNDALMNPIKRELRYILESSVKHLYVDQQTQGGQPLTELAKRLDFLETHVDHSLEVREQLELRAMHADDAKQFIAELYDAYRQSCAYVHVSRRQIEERLELRAAGKSLGFETTDELRSIARLIFRVYDMALALYFHGYGLSMSGEVFIDHLDQLPEWKFHKGKYVKLISGYFDYKHERNMRKYGESRAMPAEWPPKQL